MLLKQIYYKNADISKELLIINFIRRKREYSYDSILFVKEKKKEVNQISV